MDDDSLNLGFRDFLLLALGAFMLAVVLLLAHINPPAKEDEEITRPPGTVVVEIRWPDGSPADVDLWVKAPDDRPVGYSRQNGRHFNLLRDDLGKRNDPLEINYENAYARGAPAGRYAVNVHLYAPHGADLPIPVQAVVSIADEGRLAPVIAREVTLRDYGEEITVVRFELNRSGALVPDSVDTLYERLRGAR